MATTRKDNSSTKVAHMDSRLRTNDIGKLLDKTLIAY